VRDLSQRPRYVGPSHNSADNEWRQRLDPNLKREDEPELHVGPIAAGEKVVASQEAPTAEWLKAAYGDTLAVEMEGWGFLEALRIHIVLGIVIRGISDMLSGKSASDKAGWQTKAADAASAVAFELLSKLHSTPKAGAPRAPAGSAASAMAVADSMSKPATSGSGPSAPAASGPAFLETKSTLNAASAKPLPLAELLEKAPYAPLLKTRQYGALASLNQRGAFAYDPPVAADRHRWHGARSFSRTASFGWPATRLLPMSGRADRSGFRSPLSRHCC
jgi:Phosphorylase superfamily